MSCCNRAPTTSRSHPAGARGLRGPDGAAALVTLRLFDRDRYFWSDWLLWVIGRQGDPPPSHHHHHHPFCFYAPWGCICSSAIGRFPCGGKAPDKWVWLVSANQRPPPVFGRQGESAGTPPPYLLGTSDGASKDHPGKLVSQQNGEIWAFLRVKSHLSSWRVSYPFVFFK